MRELRTAFEHVFRDLAAHGLVEDNEQLLDSMGGILSAIMSVALIRSSRARSNHDDPRFTDIALAAFAIVLTSALLIAFVSLH